jgi:PKD repeat protein
MFFTAILMLTATVAVSAFSGTVNAQITGSVTINDGAEYTNSNLLVLNISAVNATQMRFSNDNSTWSNWEAYTSSKNWSIPTGDTNHTVYAEFQDDAEQSLNVTANIFLDQTTPEANPYVDYYSSDLKTWYFDASASTDNVGLSSCLWDFGDGNTSTSVALTHTYAAVGNYNVTLTVFDLAGNNATVSSTLTVPDMSAVPTATPTPVPTVNPTTIPTTQPTATPPPESTPTGFDSTWAIIIVAVIIIVVGSIAIVLLLMKRSKPAPPASAAY